MHDGGGVKIEVNAEKTVTSATVVVVVIGTTRSENARERGHTWSTGGRKLLKVGGQPPERIRV